MRFLIARSKDPNKAAKMFVQWQKWRAEIVPLNLIPDSEVKDELSAEKIYLQGLSRKGFPVVIVKGHKHFPSKDQPQFKSKYFCFCLCAYLFRSLLDLVWLIRLSVTNQIIRPYSMFD